MVRVDLGRSVKKGRWQTFCKHAPRLVGVIGEPSAAVHIRYDREGFTTIGQGCSLECEYATALALIDALEEWYGERPLTIWAQFGTPSVN